MEQLIQAFGIDAKLIVVQVVNFVILLALLSYYLYKPVLKVLADREEKVAQGVKDAENAAKALATAEDEKQEIVSAAHKEAEDVASRAKAHADKKAADIASTAEEKAASILSVAELKAERIKIQAQKDSEAEVAKVAVLATEKLLKQQA